MTEDVPGYRDLRWIGQGSFGVVYRAYSERLARPVALKVLLATASDESLRRFRRECELAGKVASHPHVVTVLDAGTATAGRPYVAMEYFEHGSLLDRLRRNGPLPVADALRIGIQICGALAAVHEAGVLHRDVKPQNILVSRYGLPALADFGIARLLAAAEASVGTQAFTPYHVSPEALRGEPLTAASDIYSLGSTLYQLLAGRHAFEPDSSGNLESLLLRILQGQPPPINRADLPSGVMRVLGRAMAKWPGDRFPDAATFGRRLQQAQAELDLAVTDLTFHEPADANRTDPPVVSPAATVVRAGRERVAPPAGREKPRRRWWRSRGERPAVAPIPAAGPAVVPVEPPDPPLADKSAAPTGAETVLRRGRGGAGTERPPLPEATGTAGIGRRRLTRVRWAIGLACVVLLAAAVALALHWGGRRPGPVVAGTSSPDDQPAAASAVFVTGPGCPTGTATDVQRIDSTSFPGWQTAGGGWTGDGCDGTVLYATTGVASSVNMYVWTFHPGTGHRCDVQVYVPDVAQAEGNTSYRIGQDTQDLSAGQQPTYAIVIFDQSTNRGQWVTLRTVDSTPDPLQLRLNGRPYPSGSGDHLVVASAARVSCST